MSKRFDQCCTKCDWWDEIVVPPGANPPCPRCGAPTERLWIAGFSVVGDDVPGGFTIENMGHEPVTFYSKSEYRREVERRGLVNMVRHVPVPGSDKSPHTQRWI